MTQSLYHTRGTLALALPAVPAGSIITDSVSAHDAGVNVWFIPAGLKSAAYKWKAHSRTRLDHAAVEYGQRKGYNPVWQLGATSGHLFAIDCETEQRYTKTIAMILAAGLDVFAVRTGNVAKRGGHIFYMSDTTPKHIPSKVTDGTWELQSSGYVLGMGALHPSGGVYAYDAVNSTVTTIPTLPQSQWHTLPLPPGRDGNAAVMIPAAASKIRRMHPLQRTYAGIGDKPGISSTTAAFLENGETPGRRNDALFAAACDMAANGYDAQTTLAALPALAGGDFGIDEIERTVASAYSKPRTPQVWYGRHNPRTLHSVHQFRTWLDHDLCRRGKAAQRNSDMVRTLAAIAERTGKTTFEASVRELAEAAGMRNQNVHRVMDRLAAAGVVTITKHRHRTNTYSLLLPAPQDAQDHRKAKSERTPSPILGGKSGGIDCTLGTRDTVYECNQFPQNVPPNSLALFGDNAIRVYVYLRANPDGARISDIARAAGLSRDAVRTVLAVEDTSRTVKLIPAGLVARTGNLYSVTDTSLADVAATSGIEERQQQQHARHEYERSVYLASRLFRFLARYQAQPEPAAVPEPAAPEPEPTSNEELATRIQRQRLTEERQARSGRSWRELMDNMLKEMAHAQAQAQAR